MIELSIDATSLSTSSCLRNFKLTVIGELEDQLGGYKSVSNAAMVYGVACHKFVDTMFKTGDYPTARTEADKSFNVTKLPPPEKKPWLVSPAHFKTTCYNVWNDYILKDNVFDILEVPNVCWWCKGIKDESKPACTHCNGTGIKLGPATELTFKIPFYEAEGIIIYLCGTIDKLGKFKNGCYAIGDYKFTSAYKPEEYLSAFEMSRQLRVYILACKLMSMKYPDSILGTIGNSQMGAFIDAIFLKSQANDNIYVRSDVMPYKSDDIEAFYWMLKDFCANLHKAIMNDHFPKQGILNGTCQQQFSRCRFWDVCKSNDQVAKLLLTKNFTRKTYNPLNFNGNE